MIRNASIKGSLEFCFPDMFFIFLNRPSHQNPSKSWKIRIITADDDDEQICKVIKTDWRGDLIK